MRIIVDMEGERSIKTLIDCALKYSGLEGLQFAVSVIESMTRSSEEDDKNEKQYDINSKGSCKK